MYTLLPGYVEALRRGVERRACLMDLLPARLAYGMSDERRTTHELRGPGTSLSISDLIAQPRAAIEPRERGAAQGRPAIVLVEDKDKDESALSIVGPAVAGILVEGGSRWPGASGRMPRKASSDTSPKVRLSGLIPNSCAPLVKPIDCSDPNCGATDVRELVRRGSYMPSPEIRTKTKSSRLPRAECRLRDCRPRRVGGLRRLGSAKGTYSR